MPYGSELQHPTGVRGTTTKKRLWAYHLKITFRCSNGTALDPFPSHVSVLHQYITVILCINYARTISKPLLEVARATLATFSTRGGNFDHSLELNLNLISKSKYGQRPSLL